MSLRRKNFIAIIATLIALVIVLFGVSQFIILRQFDEQQQDAVHSNMDRALNALDSELDHLSSITSDWAYWDDTYTFAQDHNQAYIDSNLTSDTLDNLSLDFMLFVNNHGQTIYLKTRTKLDITPRSISNTLDVQPDILHALLTLPEPLHVNRGIILVSQMPALVASRAILESSKIGTPRGMLIIGRYLNEATIAEMSQQTQLTLKFNLYDSQQSDTDFASAKAIFAASPATSLIYRSKDQMAQGYSLVKDILDRPTLILQIQNRNRIYQAGQQAVFYILVMLLVAGLVFGIVIISLSERIVISRLAYMDRRIAEISGSNDLSARIPMSGNDEVARLAATINDSLSKREQSQEECFKELNTALTHANDELQEKIEDLKANQKYKDRFFNHASHEFRTPIAIMRNRLYLARKKPEQWEAHIDSLEDTLSRLINVIDDIFDMTKLQDHNLTLNKQPIDLKSFMPMVLEGLSSKFKAVDMKLQHQFTSDDLPVTIDFIHLGRACFKLINFMLDLSQPNSELVVTLQKLTVAGKSVAAIEISSQSLQFKTDEISQMFSPFYQVSEGNVQNTGLNLAIAQQIINVHEGTLSASNDPVKGAKFQIILPIDS